MSATFDSNNSSRCRRRRRVSSRAGALFVELLVLIAIIGLGVIVASRSLMRSMSTASAQTAQAVIEMTPLSVEAPSSQAQAALGLSASPESGRPPTSQDGHGAGASPDAQPAPASEESIFDKAKRLGSGLVNVVLAKPRADAKQVQDAMQWVDGHIDESKDQWRSLNDAQAKRAEGVPVLGPLNQAAAFVQNQNLEAQAGVGKAIVGLLGGPLQAVADPADALGGVEEFAEHSSIGLPVPNALKVAHGLWNAASSDKPLADELKRTLNPIESSADDADYFLRPYQEDWNKGNRTEAIAHGLTDFAAMIFGGEAAGDALGLPRGLPEEPAPGLGVTPKAEVPVAPAPDPKLPDPKAPEPAPPAPKSAPKTPEADTPKAGREPPTEHPTVDARDKAVERDAAKQQYGLNTDNIANAEKIKGEPDVSQLADANREAAAAEREAMKPDVEDVYMGRAADQRINGKVGQGASCDVVAVTREQQYYLTEVKGKNGIAKGVTQLTKSGEQLGTDQVLSYSMVVPEGELEAGYTIENGKLMLHGQPELIDGKTIDVIRARQ
jgi:hypothetical protein